MKAEGIPRPCEASASEISNFSDLKILFDKIGSWGFRASDYWRFSCSVPCRMSYRWNISYRTGDICTHRNASSKFPSTWTDFRNICTRICPLACYFCNFLWSTWSLPLLTHKLPQLWSHRRILSRDGKNGRFWPLDLPLQLWFLVKTHRRGTLQSQLLHRQRLSH